jgi:hypothetical protein
MALEVGRRRRPDAPLIREQSTAARLAAGKLPATRPQRLPRTSGRAPIRLSSAFLLPALDEPRIAKKDGKLRYDRWAYFRACLQGTST